ncbi:hypothetical protein KJ359_011160 [Pestalotiopsis sp. 9143b]|nr:hypothetical protein KJ359_011160 [Pestalotiopsis sp. 9143b]
MDRGHLPRLAPCAQTSSSTSFDEIGTYATASTSPDNSFDFIECTPNPPVQVIGKDVEAHIGDKESCGGRRAKMSPPNEPQPRLGCFDSIDLSCTVDYRQRPKTPGIFVPPEMRTSQLHLATPPHTPEDRQFSLSAALNNAVELADFGASQTMVSPVSAEPAGALGIVPSAANVNDSVSTSTSAHTALVTKEVLMNETHNRNGSLETLSSRATSHDESTAQVSKSPGTLLEDAEFLVPRAAQSPTAMMAHNSSGVQALFQETAHIARHLELDDEKPIHPLYTASYTASTGNHDRGCATETAQGTAKTARLESYAELFRAVVGSTHHLDISDGVEARTEMSPAASRLQTLPLRSGTKTPTAESDYNVQTKPGQSQRPFFYSGNVAEDPPTPEALARARSMLNDPTGTCTSPVTPISGTQLIQKDQSAFAAAMTATRNIGRHAQGESAIDEDDEEGGCSVLHSALLLPIELSDPPKVSFSRKIPSLADQSIQDAFRSQVHSIATFSARFRTAQALTKEQKFDNLISKIAVKNLLDPNRDEDDAREVHTFIDMSNIFIGFQDTAKTSQGLPVSARVTFAPFSFEHLAFVLERGRNTVKRKLAGSVRHAHQMNNLPIHIADAQTYGYDCKILHQVVKLDQNQPLPYSPYNSADEARTGILCPRTKLGEQGVDEALHLSMQDSILDAQGSPGIMVLGTGDAKPAEFSDGFAHYAIKALKHGWQVEVVSWRKCLSSEWKKSPFKDKYAEQFRVIILDDFFDEIHANWSGGRSAALAWA